MHIALIVNFLLFLVLAETGVMAALVSTLIAPM
jgi:hypothetical protein